MYLAESTIDTTKSLRSTNSGCPYIQVVCEELIDKWKTHSLDDIFTMFVAKKLQGYKDKPDGPRKWTLTPEFSLMGNTTLNMNLELFNVLRSTIAR